MFTLAAIIRNHFCVVPYTETKGSVTNLKGEANQTFGPGRLGAWPSSHCSDDIPAGREGGRKMFKLTAAIRNHFAFFPYLEPKSAPSRRSRATLAPGAAWHSSGVVVPKPLASSSRLHRGDVEALNASAGVTYPPAPTPALVPDSSFTSLACKAPAVCSQLQRMSR
jgi:hypothetical protein